MCHIADLHGTPLINYCYMVDKNLIGLYEAGFVKHWDQPALSNWGANTFRYCDVAERIARLHAIYERLGVAPGDKIALMGKDSAEWCVIFLSSITYGAVIVPILPEFAPADAAGIIAHSEAKILFTTPEHYANLSQHPMPEVRYVLQVQALAPIAEAGLEDTAQLLHEAEEAFARRYPHGVKKEDVHYRHTSNDDLILLNYTSGTTGFSKGVMVTGRNLAANILYCWDKQILREREQLLCFLPLAHTYSCTINLLLATTLGTHVTILGRVPTPTILLQALAQIQPRTIVSVPLVLEKIYQSSILPQISKGLPKLLLGIPLLRNLVYKKVRRTLIEKMGGHLENFICGGAAINPEVAAFLHRAGFPLTVGYGMTECAPLISYTPPWEGWRLGSSGRVLQGYMQVRIDPHLDEATGEMKKDEKGRPVGEIQVKGDCTCLGYYKNAEATEALFTPDGWLRTGDLGSVDEKDYIYIKGRSKNMLLSSNGQNIYPEEIEAKISLLPYVLESVVVMRRGHLQAIIVLNPVAIEQAGITADEAWQAVEAARRELNERLGAYEKVQRFERRDTPFEKTPKHSIKRYLYS